jgi:hypothetical protein
VNVWSGKRLHESNRNNAGYYRLIELAWDEIPVLVISGNELPVYAGERPLGQKTDSLQKCNHKLSFMTGQIN